jgi:tetratricopeptide (TPR) repeat protein
MAHPLTSDQSHGGNGRHGSSPRTRRVLNVRILVSTFLALMAVWIGLHFWRAYQVRRNASDLTKRAEALADDKKYEEAANYYTRYLELCPDDADARLRRAEIFEKSSREQHGYQRAIELYQYALASPGSGLTAVNRIKAQRRVCELLLECDEFAGALNQSKKLDELEKKELAGTPNQWQAPGLKAMANAGIFREGSSAVTKKDVEDGFAEVLDPQGKDPKVFVDPRVYLARYDYMVQKHLANQKDGNAAEAFLIASKAAESNLDDALKLAPENIAVLLSVANAARLRGDAELRALRGVEPAKSVEARAQMDAFYSRAVDYFERAIKSDREDPRPYYELGQLFASRGDVDRAIRTWRRGLEAVKNEGPRIGINLLLVNSLIQLGQYSDAETVLKDLNERLSRFDPRSRLALQRLVDLRSGKLAYLRGRYDEAIRLVTDLASGTMLIQGEESSAKPHDRYEAWLLIGQANADLAAVFRSAATQYSESAAQQATSHDWDLAMKEAAAQHWDIALKEIAPEPWSLAQKEAAAQHWNVAMKQLGVALREVAAQHWTRALAGFDQAASYEPHEVAPHLAAAEASAAAGRGDAAVTNYQHALEVVGALKPPPEDLELTICDALVALLKEQKRTTESDLYAGRRLNLMVKSARLIPQAVNEALRDGKLEEAVKIAESGVKNHPENPLTHVAMGRAEQANKQVEKAAEAYRKAFQAMKDSPALQVELAVALLSSGNPSDASEGERALREMAPKYPQACLKLVMNLANRDKADEALSVARLGLQGNPKEPIYHAAMGLAWAANKDNTKAEAELQEAVRVAPDSLGAATALLEFYIATGQGKLARETLDKLLAMNKERTAAIELWHGDTLVRIGNRRDAKAAYEKAVELAKDDPAVAMRLAEFLLNSGDPADDAEAEKLLRRVKRQHDPARRKLAQMLTIRGGDSEWEEAQKLLEQSAGDQASFIDRIMEARLLTRRGGGQNLEKAAAICQELLDEAKNSKRPLPGVTLMLAQARELQGNLDEARKQYLALVDQNYPVPSLLANYIAFLLRHGPAVETDKRTEQFLKMAPEDLTALEFRSRCLRAQNRTAEIEPLVEGRMQKVLERLKKSDTRQEAMIVQAVGNLFQRLELYAAAERWYRRLQKLGVNLYPSLAMSMAKQGRIDEALSVCEEAGKSDGSPLPALTVAEVVTTGRATTEELERALLYLKKAAEKHTEQPALLNCVAGVDALLDRPGQAIELYREILKKQPKNAVVLGDLATVLAEEPKEECRKEALECIERAIELAGPQPNLLDTKGMALFYDGKLDRAEIVLRSAAHSPNPDPRFCFHYALVCAKLGNLDAARTALRQARAGDLEHQLLTIKDRQLLTELEKQVAQ